MYCEYAGTGAPSMAARRLRGMGRGRPPFWRR
jgi:hypothetical protein